MNLTIYCFIKFLFFCTQITDQDLIKRRVGQRVDPVTNKLFTRDVYSPESHSAGGEASKEGEDGEDDDDEEEEVDDGGEGDKESGVDDQFRDDLVRILMVVHNYYVCFKCEVTHGM